MCPPSISIITVLVEAAYCSSGDVFDVIDLCRIDLSKMKKLDKGPAFVQISCCQFISY